MIFPLIDKKLTISLSVIAGLILISVLSLSSWSTQFFQGKLPSDGKGEEGRYGAAVDAPWWCKKQETSTGGYEEEAIQPNGADGGVDGGPGLREEKPGGKKSGGKVETGKPVGGIVDIDIEPIFSLPYGPLDVYAVPKGLATVKDEGFKPPVYDPPEKPKEEPPSDKPAELYYECSCDASYFELEGIDGTLSCPEQGTEDTWEVIDKDGVNSKIKVVTPQLGACQKRPKENETVNIAYQCGCDQKSFYLPQTKEKYKCPKPGPGEPAEYGDGKPYSIYVWATPEYFCNEELQCPQGYQWDWKKINDDCGALKANECSGKQLYDVELEYGDTSLCEAFVPSKFKKSCENIDECKDSIKLFKQTGSSPEGLPAPWDCYSIYGDEDSKVWD